MIPKQRTGFRKLASKNPISTQKPRRKNEILPIMAFEILRNIAADLRMHAFLQLWLMNVQIVPTKKNLCYAFAG